MNQLRTGLGQSGELSEIDPLFLEGLVSLGTSSLELPSSQDEPYPNFYNARLARNGRFDF